MNDKRKTQTLEDIIGIIDIPPVEGRFQEILSTQKILDTETGIEFQLPQPVEVVDCELFLQSAG